MLTQTPSRMSALPTASEIQRPEPQALPAPVHYPLAEQLPDTGSVTEVAPGIFWLRMALPFALNHINLWLLRDRMPHPTQSGTVQEGWTAVDCGIDNPATREAWLQLEANVLQGLPILRVLVTHMHPDHVGLAHWLCERWHAPLWISTSEYQAAMLSSNAVTRFDGPLATEFFQAHGWHQAPELAQAMARMGDYPSMVPQVPRAYVRLMAGAQVHIGERSWQCIAGYGHSPEHMALHDAQGHVLISGDMLLPSISTNISVSSKEPMGNPLALFLDSLERMAHLLDETLVLPSHGRPFTGAATRVQQLRVHHEERLADLLQACSESEPCAHELLPLLFKRTLDGHQTPFAMGEAIAHLNLLWLAGQLEPAGIQ